MVFSHKSLFMNDVPISIIEGYINYLHHSEYLSSNIQLISNIFMYEQIILHPKQFHDVLELLAKESRLGS